MRGPRHRDRRGPAGRLGVLVAFLLVAAATTGCLADRLPASIAGTEDARDAAPDQIGAQRAVQVATPHALDWNDRARLAAAMAIEVPDETTLQAVAEANGSRMPGWLAQIATEHFDPNVADGEAPFWVLRFVAGDEVRGYAVKAPDKEVAVLPEDVPLGKTPALGNWSVDAAQAVDVARQADQAPPEGTTSEGLVLSLVSARGDGTTIPAWKVAGELSGDDRPVIVDARTGDRISQAR